MGHPLAVRARDKFTRLASRLMYRRPLKIAAGGPLISFTFDDFPRTALLNAGAILKRYELRATYYAALGLMGKTGPVGEMFLPEDLTAALGDGHELGCHTYRHENAARTPPVAFEASILENRRDLGELLPGIHFRSLSYPYAAPRPGVKAKAARYFDCCRGGGQTFNSGTADLNDLSSFFLEKTNGRTQAAKDVIDDACRAGAWLILDTHDVCATPSRFGCTTEFFEEIVAYAVGSAATILPVGEALHILKTRPDNGGDLADTSE